MEDGFSQTTMSFWTPVLKYLVCLFLNLPFASPQSQVHLGTCLFLSKMTDFSLFCPKMTSNVKRRHRHVHLVCIFMEPRPPNLIRLLGTDPPSCNARMYLLVVCTQTFPRDSVTFCINRGAVERHQEKTHILDVAFMVKADLP